MLEVPAALAAMPFTVNAPALGAVTSFANVRVVCALFEAPSVPVTISVGEPPVPCAHEKLLDTNGPPAGVDTVEGVCDQPLIVGTGWALISLLGS